MSIAPVGQLPPVSAIPGKVGAASGTVQMDEFSVTLRNAYASGPIDAGGTLYQIVLTDIRFRVRQFRKIERGGQQLLKTGS